MLDKPKKIKLISRVEPVSRLLIGKEGNVAPFIGRMFRECVSNRH